MLRFGLFLSSLLFVLLSAGAAFALGNAWHIPEGAEPMIPTMRSPLSAIGASTTVAIFSGNQFQGTSGNPKNQLEAGSALFYRKQGSATWSQASLEYFSTNGNNKYFRAELPGGAFAAGDAVEYYLRIAYSDEATTYLYGNDEQSLATGTESVAQGGAFRFTVEPPLAPSGEHLSIVKGAWEARVYQATGHVELVGPDLAGKALASSVALAPARAKIGGVWIPIGSVLASKVTADGLDLTQSFGSTSVTAHLGFVAEATLRYEVTDWGGAAPAETLVIGASDADEHVYGFGEKFDALDQAGKLVRMLATDAAGNKGDRSYKVAPWFLSTKGYGFHLDSSAESTFDMRASNPDRWVVRNIHSSLAYHLVHGPTLADALSRYTGLTGRPPLPPKWVFAPWISSDIWQSGGEVRYVVTKLREAKIPHSVFVFDSPWETAYNDFTWNTTQFASGGTFETKSYDGFASPAEMLSFLRHSGFKVVLWMTPFVDVSSKDEGVAGQNLGQADNYAEAAQKGYFVRSSPNGPPLVVDWWKGSGSPVDFTSADARAWLVAQLKALVAEGGGRDRWVQDRRRRE